LFSGRTRYQRLDAQALLYYAGRDEIKKDELLEMPQCRQPRTAKGRKYTKPAKPSILKQNRDHYGTITASNERL